MKASELRQVNYEHDAMKHIKNFEGKMHVQSFNVNNNEEEKKDKFQDDIMNKNEVNNKGDENCVKEFSLIENEKQEENCLKLDEEEKLHYKTKFMINLGKPKKNKKEKKLSKKKGNSIIDSEGWYLLYENLVADKNNIVQAFKVNYYLPIISEYIVANSEKDTHVFLLFNSSYTYNEKISPEVFNYKDIVPQISECQYWTDNKALSNLCKDPNNYITNIDGKRMETARQNLSFLDYDIIKLAKMGKISLH